MTTVTEPVIDTGTVTTTAYDLNVLLSGAAPFADNPDYHPTLGCVRLEAGGGVICTSATDRYHLAHVRRPADGDLAPVYLRRDTVEGIVKRLDARAQFVGDARERVRISASKGRLDIVVGDHVMHPETEKIEDWPDLGKVISQGNTGNHNTEGPVGIGVHSMKLLAEALEAMDHPRAVMRWSLGGPKSPILAELGDWFVALFMPCVARVHETPYGSMPRVPYGLPNS